MVDSCDIHVFISVSSSHNRFFPGDRLARWYVVMQKLMA